MAVRAARLDGGVSVSGQVSAEDFAALAADGVRLVVNNRPDDEDPGQMSAAQGAEIASRHGLAYRHIPITYASITRADVDAFADAMQESGGRMHAHCRSGPRSEVLWALAAMLRGKESPETVAMRAREAGFDVSPAFAWLEAHPEAGG